MGPSGSGPTPVTVFSQNFDAAGYVPTSQFTTYPASNAPTLSLDGSHFLSAPESLMVSGGTSGTTDFCGVYVPFSYSGGDYYFSATLYYAKFTDLGGALAEFIFAYQEKILADVGYDPSSGSLYTCNSPTRVSIANGININNFHTLLLAYHGSTGLSDVTVDGLLLAQNVNALETAAPGIGGAYAGIYFPLGVAAGNYVDIDNFEIYHY